MLLDDRNKMTGNTNDKEVLAVTLYKRNAG